MDGNDKVNPMTEMNVDVAGKTLIRENIEWISIRRHNATDTTLRRVLLVGDSIVLGHGTKVHELLKDKVCVDFFATTKHVSDAEFMSDIDFMLARGNYALIVFNNGLHGFGIDDALYKPALREVLMILKGRVRGLAVRNCTPMLDKRDRKKLDPKRTPRVKRRNRDAAAVAKALGLPVLDLYAEMVKRKSLFSDHAHCTEAGKQFQAERIADFIRALLPDVF